MVAATQTNGPTQRWYSTDRELKALKPARAGKPGAPKRRYIVWDATQPHLGVRVTESGARSFVVVRRMPGERNPVTHVLGSYPALTLKAAREEAPGILATIIGGKRPREVAAEQQRANARKRRDTFAVAVGTTRIEGVVPFLQDEQSKGLRSSGGTEMVLRREFVGQTWRHVWIEQDGKKKRTIQWSNGPDPIWRDRPILEITRREVIERLDAIKRRGGKHAARHALNAIRKFFNWCAEGERFGVETSPCANVLDKTIGITRKDLERKRVLTDDELRDVWHAAEECGSADSVVASYPYAPLVRLLVLTGQRLNDIASARWNEIDLDKAMLTVPPERYKTNTAQQVPLSPLAVEMLRALPRFTRGYVFTTTAGARPVSGLSKMKARLDAAITKRREQRGAGPMPHWVLHDLRRTVRTRLVSDLDFEAYIAERVMGHALPGLHSVYDQGTHGKQKRDALEKWAAALAAIVEVPPAPDGAVVSAEEMNRRRQSKRR
jgi:integrase